mmetsp:Transcript_12630/g.19641  ORF Transcript_12630/g.19641 Transcript_12630/m.19641 type:complete len:95 (+) Transcript_12630:422-706(+)
MTNYDLLKSLGFDDQLIEENKKLGLKEKTVKSSLTMKQYLQEMAVAEDKTFKENVFKKETGFKGSTIKEEENFDWKFISITPPPKKEPKKGDLV